MSPPRAPGGPIRDPLHEETAPPPADPPTSDTPPVPTGTVAPTVVPSETVAPANPNSPTSTVPAEEGPDTTPEAWKRLHLVLGGGYIFPGARVYGDAEPYASAAASHHGGTLLIQPSYSVLRSRWFDLNLGLNIQHSWLSVPRSAGSVSSDIGATTLAGLVEGNVFFHPEFGLGLNAHLGYMGLSSSNADVGGPYSASLNFDGNVAVGAQLYLHAWRGAFRAGAGLNWMGGGFGVSSPGNPDLLTSVSPQWSIFLGVDPLQIIRNATGRAGERPRD